MNKKQEALKRLSQLYDEFSSESNTAMMEEISQISAIVDSIDEGKTSSEVIIETAIAVEKRIVSALSSDIIARIKPLEDSKVDYLENDLARLNMIVDEIAQRKFLGIPLGLIYVDKSTRLVDKKVSDFNINKKSGVEDARKQNNKKSN